MAVVANSGNTPFVELWSSERVPHHECVDMDRPQETARVQVPLERGELPAMLKNSTMVQAELISICHPDQE